MTTPFPNFEVMCETDDGAAPGIPIMVTIKMNQRNDYHAIVGLTDDDGKLAVDADVLLAEVKTSLELFPGDYMPVDGTSTAFAQVLEVHAMTVSEIEAALHAYDLWHTVTSYPPDYRSNLEEGFKNLLQQSPRSLSVSISGMNSTPKPVRIKPISIPFPVTAAAHCA